jgi:AraC family transcriptional regulator of adaptative response / DNA-3-methyladenine glycosylase II
MKPDSKASYKALSARDPRFDGVFFVGVTSTGIYCRPVCPAKTPKESNCRFYASPQEAEQEGFRPCLRCRPELAPGNAPVDDAQRIAHLIVQRLEAGAPEGGLEEIAAQFELSSRQIRRIIRKELGVPPIQLILTRRLLLAKQLLTETKLPVTEIAFASGFGSLRRFNDAFLGRYGLPPSRLRKQAVSDAAFSGSETSTLQLSYRPPYDWPGILAFLRMRGLKGVELVTEDSYARTVVIGRHKGWIKVTQPQNGKNALRLEFTHSLAPVLPALIARIRDLFDLNARPDMIAKHLRRDKLLAPMIKANPGLRVPGAFSGFEIGLRAILGQQVTVKAATTIAGRLAAAFGEPVATPFPELSRLTPSPARLAKAGIGDLAKHGIVSARCKSIIALAQAEVSGALSLDSGAHHNIDVAIARLAALPGIGPWTAHYIAMRALRWPDAFPKGDVAVLNNLGGITAKEADALSQSWRPWRSYAMLHIWKNPLK